MERDGSSESEENEICVMCERERCVSELYNIGRPVREGREIETERE